MSNREIFERYIPSARCQLAHLTAQLTTAYLLAATAPTTRQFVGIRALSSCIPKTSKNDGRQLDKEFRESQGLAAETTGLAA
jgi:hypothetical protein